MALTKDKKRQLKDEVIKALHDCDVKTISTILCERPELLYEDYLRTDCKEHCYHSYNITVKDGRLCLCKDDADRGQTDGYFISTVYEDDSRKLASFCYLPIHREIMELLLSLGESPDHKVKHPTIRMDGTYHSTRTALAGLVNYLHILIDRSHNLKDCENGLEDLDIVLGEIHDYYNFLLDAGADPFLVAPFAYNSSASYDYKYVTNYMSPFMALMQAMFRLSAKYPDKTAPLKEMVLKSLEKAPVRDCSNILSGVSLITRKRNCEEKEEKRIRNAQTVQETPLENIFHQLCEAIDKKCGETLIDTLFEILEYYCGKLTPEEITRNAVVKNWHGRASLVRADGDSFGYWERLEEFLLKYVPLTQDSGYECLFRPLLHYEKSCLSQKFAWYAEHGIDFSIRDCEGSSVWHCFTEFLRRDKDLPAAFQKWRGPLDLPEEEYKNLLGILYQNYPEGINERNSDGDTPLHLLCGALAFEYQNRQKGEVDLSERIMCYGRLIEYMEGMGADADIRNNDRQTPLELLPRDVRKTIEQQLLTKDTLEQDIDIYDR